MLSFLNQLPSWLDLAKDSTSIQSLGPNFLGENARSLFTSCLSWWVLLLVPNPHPSLDAHPSCWHSEHIWCPQWTAHAIVDCSSTHPSEAAGLVSGTVTGPWNMFTIHQLREVVLKEVRLLFPRGHLVMSKDTFVVVDVTEFYCYLESRGQRCHQTSCNAQDSPHSRELSGPKWQVCWGWETLVWRHFETHMPGERICRIILNRSMSELEQILWPKKTPLGAFIPTGLTPQGDCHPMLHPWQYMKVLAHIHTETLVELRKDVHCPLLLHKSVCKEGHPVLCMHAKNTEFCAWVSVMFHSLWPNRL